jgi:DNA-directed RNA polymerase subunit RPC12/RpoP
VAKRKINAHDVMADIRAGVGDFALMEKYGLSAKGLQSLFTKLVDAGLIDSSKLLDQRVPESELTVDLVSRCPRCGHVQEKMFMVCPKCGGRVPVA